MLLTSPAAECLLDEAQSSPVFARGVDPRERRLRHAVRAYHRSVWRLLRRLGIPEASADDAAQQVFITLDRRLDEIEEGRERAFLMGVALRVAANSRRAAARFARVVDHAASLDTQPECDGGGVEHLNPEQLVESKRRRAMLDQVLARLPEAQRVVLVLFELEELTTSEIADALSIPSGTVSSRLRRARILFRLEAQKLYRGQRRLGA